MVNSKYGLGLYEKALPIELTWREKLSYCKEFGFDWLEISIDETDQKLARLDWTSEEIENLKKDMFEIGIPIKTMCLSGHRKYPLGSLDDETIQRSIEILSKALSLANKLGIRIVQLAGYDIYYTNSTEESKKSFLKNLKIGVELAAQEGVVLGFETMETPFMDTVGKAINYVELVNSPYLQVYPDTGNLTNASLVYQHNVLDDIRLGKGHIVAAHLKETLPNIYREVEYGKGHTDFYEIVKVCRSLGVHLFVGEFWYVGQDNWQEDCRKSNKYLREKLDKAFND